MAPHRRVYDSRHLQADCQEPGSAPELRSAVEYGLPLLMQHYYLLRWHRIAESIMHPSGVRLSVVSLCPVLFPNVNAVG